MTLGYIRNKHFGVEHLEDGKIRVRIHVEETVCSASMEVVARLPDLEIISIEAQMARPLHEPCKAAVSMVERLKGLRIGPGLRKIAEGLIGGPKGCRTLVDLFIESCDGVILSFTLPQIERQQKGTDEERRKAHREMLKTNPRLIRSCVAFADDSPLMEEFRTGR